MKWIKYLIFIITAIAANSCDTTKKVPFHKEAVVKNIPTQKSILLSCYRCGCVTSALQSFAAIPDPKREITIYADSACGMDNRGIPFTQLSQRIIDSIYLRNYNAILVYQKGKDIRWRLLTTDESEDFLNITRKFFRED
jgi:hypothetical protein